MKLLITLGHNSSAILVKDEEVLIGYEEERLSHIKADSAFPVLALSKILEYYPEAGNEVEDIFISHWFWHWDLKDDKYYNPQYLNVNFPYGKIRSLSKSFTHHDAHANSVWNFSGKSTGTTIIADGFGNMGEVLSIYTNGKLRHRSYELEWSLGLMYQYATAYLGMKENQDEYKLLGYEQSCTTAEKNSLIDIINTTSSLQIKALSNPSSKPNNGDMALELMKVRTKWYTLFDQITEGRKSKPLVARFVQKLVERTISAFASNAEVLQVSGGVFYNVKLNNTLVRLPNVKFFEANPLAGDQGCALGMTRVKYEHVFWGKRDEYIVESHRGYTQVLMGAMEFGPRALGNTSTIADPTSEMVEKINKLNGRDTIMPMAPIVTDEFAKNNFRDYHKLGKCRFYMIVALDYKNLLDKYRGAAHVDTDRKTYTGRPQVINEYTNEYVRDFVSDIMINTSLNAHGQPIIYNEQDFDIMEDLQN